MAERQNRDPAYDLGRHIVTGEKVPLSGDPVIRQYDAELDRNNPMDDWVRGADNFVVPQSADEVIRANADQSLNLASAAGEPGLQIDMAVASDCKDEPSKGGIAYGPRNTGGY